MDPTTPFLRWAGGKRWLAKFVSDFFKETDGKYFEPFLGAGSMFFSAAPKKAILSDLNDELIQTFMQVRDDPSALLTKLKKFKVSKEAFLGVRSWRPRSRLNIAARMIYLNRTAFNGLYRLNRLGEFNVPYGGRNLDAILQGDLLLKASKVLRSAELGTSDFEDTLARAGAGDVIYCDPAYTVTHANGSFLRYNESVFSWKDQKRLRGAALDAVSREATVIVSNAYHHCIDELYRPYRPLILSRDSMIGAITCRGDFSESLFVLSLHSSARRRIKALLARSGHLMS